MTRNDIRMRSMTMRWTVPLAVAVSVCIVDASAARDRGQYAGVDPAIRACIKALQTPASGPQGCCEISDGYPVEAEDWAQQPDGTYRVRITIDGAAGWYAVPADAMLTPGACGLQYAIVWWFRRNALDPGKPATPVIQCFKAGTSG
jgi:hypothetical protein